VKDFRLQVNVASAAFIKDAVSSTVFFIFGGGNEIRTRRADPVPRSVRAYTLPPFEFIKRRANSLIKAVLHLASRYFPRYSLPYIYYTELLNFI